MSIQSEHEHVAAIIRGLTEVTYSQGVGEGMTIPAQSADGSQPSGFAGWDFEESFSMLASFAGDELISGAVVLDIFEQKGSRGKLIRAASAEARDAFKAASTGAFAFLTFVKADRLETNGYVGRRFLANFKTFRE